MPQHTDVEALLERSLKECDLVSPTSDVVGNAVRIGRQRARARRGLASGGVVLGVVAVVSVAAGVTNMLGSSPQPDEDRESIEASSQSPRHGTPSSSLRPAFMWAKGLPSGSAPKMPYLIDTTLYLPDGAEVKLDGAQSASIIGYGPFGTIVNVFMISGAYDGGYYLVEPSGDVTRMGDGVIRNAQEALVSPDGRYFTDGDTVTDLASMTRVGTVPRNAAVMLNWNATGVVFSTIDQNYWLWDPRNETQIELGELPVGFTAGSDALIAHDGKCAVVGRPTRTGIIEVQRSCDLPILTASNAGTAAITSDLRILTTAGATESLESFPSAATIEQADLAWESDAVFLVSLGSDAQQGEVDIEQGRVTRGVIVRCSTVRMSCERATDVMDVPSGQRVIDLPGN